jgi:hypothetical protein
MIVSLQIGECRARRQKGMRFAAKNVNTYYILQQG